MSYTRPTSPCNSLRNFNRKKRGKFTSKRAQTAKKSKTLTESVFHSSRKSYFSLEPSGFSSAVDLAFSIMARVLRSPRLPKITSAFRILQRQTGQRAIYGHVNYTPISSLVLMTGKSSTDSRGRLRLIAIARIS